MESGKSVAGENNIKAEVVLQIMGGNESLGANKESRDSKVVSLPKGSTDLKLELTEAQRSPSSDVNKMSPNLLKPPKISNETISRRLSFSRSSFSKPKSRFVEPPQYAESNLAEEKAQMKSSTSSPHWNSPKVVSPSGKVAVSTPREVLKSAPITPKALGSPYEEEDDEEVYKTADLKVKEITGKKLKNMVLMEWIAFVCIMGCLIASLLVNKLEHTEIWGLELWKWCVLVLVIFCGRLFSRWFINCLVFLIERNFVLKKKVLYFVFGLRKSAIVLIWLGLVLLAWALLFDGDSNRSKKTNDILNGVTRSLASCLIGAAIWLVKTLLIKLLASAFQCTRFFDRIQESIFHQYVLRTLSGPPLMEMAERIGSTASTGQLSFRKLKKEKNDEKEGKEEVIDVDKLKKMNQEKISAWTMKGLIDVIRSSGLSTISNSLESFDDEENDKEINSEWEAKAAAYQIFRNVAKPGSKYIDEEDLLRFMKKEEVNNVLPLFEGAVETGKIKRKSLKNWIVNVYLERKSLAHSLNDTKTAIDELNKLASVVVIVVIIIVWLLLMGFLTTQILVLISSQLLLAVFVFGNAAKTLFEAIIFVFVMHPFDVGDRCVVDGVQMVVEEMNILTTVFLKYDNEKILYPNSVLATKPIGNFYRSPEMSDAVEFAVDVSTSIESIGALKSRIKLYLESKSQHWRPGHSVIIKEIEDVNKMKMGLYVTHTINFQNYGDKSSRRSELLLELKKIFEELSIKYHLLPQEVYVSSVGSVASAILPSRR